MSNHEPKLSGFKTCSKCLISKHVLAFAVNKKSSDGLHNECRDCVRVKSKEKYKDKKSNKPKKPFYDFPINRGDD